jgi:hypothetical protein
MNTPASTLQQPFELQHQHASRANALAMARLARLAYVPDFVAFGAGSNGRFPDLHEFAAAFPFVRPLRRGRAEGFVASNARDVVVSIRGYREPDRWLDALPYSQVKGFGGRVSVGARDHALSVWDDVLAAFFDANVGDKRLWLTGHSVGGASVTVLAAQLDAEGFDLEAVYTFGAPAVFDRAAAAKYRPRLLRYVNDGDWIPEMQWPRLGNPYYHVGDRILLLRSGAVGSGRYPDHLARRIDRFMNIETPMGHGDALDDHRADEYIRRLS